MSRSTAQSRRSGKGQSSVEFMILFILFLIALTAALAVSINRTNMVSNAQISLESNRVLGDVADNINIAYLEGDGFSMNVTIPDRILRINYTIEINSNEAILKMSGNTFIKYLLTNNVTGSFVKGTNKILNRNGEIVITEAR